MTQVHATVVPEWFARQIASIPGNLTVYPYIRGTTAFATTLAGTLMHWPVRKLKDLLQGRKVEEMEIQRSGTAHLHSVINEDEKRMMDKSFDECVLLNADADELTTWKRVYEDIVDNATFMAGNKLVLKNCHQCRPAKAS